MKATSRFISALMLVFFAYGSGFADAPKNFTVRSNPSSADYIINIGNSAGWVDSKMTIAQLAALIGQRCWQGNASPPADSIGVDGDTYINTSTGFIYYKASGSWGVAIRYAAQGANSDITSLNGLTTPLTPPQGGAGADTSAMSGLAKMTNGVVSVAEAGTDYSTPTNEYTVGQIAALSPSTGDVIRVTNGASPCDTTTGGGAYISEHRFDGTNWICIGDGGGGSGAGDWTAQTSAPSHGVQPMWRVDPASFNPCNSTDSTEYWIFDDQTSWQPLWNIDGTPIIQTAVVGTPREGWHYWFENTSNGGDDDPNDEDGISGAYRTYRTSSGYVTDLVKSTGAAVISPNQPAPVPTVSDPDTWSLNGYGYWIANAAGAADHPAVVEGMNSVVEVRGSYVVVVDPNGTEEIFLNGTSCGAGVSVQSEGDGDGESIALKYAAGNLSASGYGWICTP